MTPSYPPPQDDVRSLLTGIAGLVHANLDRVLAGRTDVAFKADGSPVTSSDLFLEELIRGFVAARVPDLVFIGEESYDPARPMAGDNVVLLDPIDGTENFCSGLKEWGVSFGLWSGGVHAGSLLLFPELGDRLMTGDRPPRLRSRITGFSSSFSEDIAAGMRMVPEARIIGCAAYNLYNVSRGAFARFSNPKGAYAWDLLPGLMLALEQGCDVRVDGEPFDGRFLDPSRRYRVDIQHRYDLHPGEGAVGRPGEERGL